MRALIAGDREAFYSAEIEMRERAAYPPFGRLASIVVSGPDQNATAAHARDLARAAPVHDDVRVLGPAEARGHDLRAVGAERRAPHLFLMAAERLAAE